MNINSWNDWEEWCQINGYDSELHDEDEEPYKREVMHSGYAFHPATNTYASVTYTSHYDYGSSNFDVHKKGLVRREKQVTKTVVTYE